ncbi:hypothetical protein [Leifsonia xyli]|uniref:hypothetical protein n=1 Tax=Leifsonia xyli TaxID=1575 RepID=UPI000425703E|nr:hypothetical protein [Leifsonia xyli]
MGAIAFRMLVNGVPGPVNGADGPVTVELPDGLRFTGTGTGTASTVSLPPEAGTGLVKVPAVQAVGAAGRYSVIARFQGATATISVDVTAGGTSDIYALPFPRSTIRGAVPLADVRHVSVSDSAYAFVDGSGALYVSGGAYGVAVRSAAADFRRAASAGHRTGSGRDP